ncbi:MAG TPA: hypothetical protein VL021_04740 [Brumimicrobium sp.]|nr:hypothetical protein [Brumimicrobium sp.]
MKKIFITIITVASLASCSSENQLCECIEAGAEADKISASFFDREATQEGKDSLDNALKKRDKICAAYQYMLAHELQEKAKDCKSLKFDPEK